MNKVFLSHSSQDKKHYLNIVAERLGHENIEYDAWTFEEGEKTISEIETRIDSSDLFALFISNSSLDSDWVINEISRAHEKISAGAIKKIYPIIIDESITYEDVRIPDWLREQYNLKLINRPVIAARRIQTKLRELHWASHPIAEKRSNIFVGRNDILSDFESRMDDIDLVKPTCIIASGLKKIGRSKLLIHALAKSNITNVHYNPIKITLAREDSIEDFIYKLFDTGLTSASENNLSDMLSKTMEEKESLLARMLHDIQESKEIIFIEDNGCIVDHEREVASWLINSLTKYKFFKRPVICIAAKYRTNRRSLRDYETIYAIEIPELTTRERAGLLRRLLELYELQLEADDFSFFSEQLHGFPEEVAFCVNLIADYGIAGAKKESHQLTDFNTEKASLLLRKYESNQEYLDFIYLLSEFEFIGISFLFQIVEEEKYKPVLDELVTNLICDFIGGEQEYVRLNDTIRDLIKRNRIDLPPNLKERLKSHVENFVRDTNKFERDASDFFYSIKEALTNGETIDDKYLVPSHILRTIKDLYQKRENLKRVVKLADMLLMKESTLDKKVVQDVRYYLCLSLARQKDKRVLKEATNIHGPEHDFVLGYYYRVCGRHSDAIQRLEKLTDIPYIASRAKRELVQVFLYIEEFDKALAMAKENYEANRGNQFPTQSYLNCLLNSENPSNNREEIERLIHELGVINSSQSKEMMLIAKSLFETRINLNKTNAFNYINDAIALDEKSPYPYLAKFDIALKFNDTNTMTQTLQHIEEVSKSRSFSKNTVSKNRAYLKAATGQLADAIHIVRTELDNYPTETIQKLITKLNKIAGK